MSYQTRAENALRLAGGDGHEYEIEEFYPVPFPDDVPTIQLEKISLSKLLNGDPLEAKNVFDICTTTGFFYLDMLDHPTGRQLWQNVCKVCHRGRERFVNTPVEEKLKYKPLDGVRVFDRGYALICLSRGGLLLNGLPRYLLRTADQAGQSDLREILNVCNNIPAPLGFQADYQRYPKVNSLVPRQKAAVFRPGFYQMKISIGRR
jgi:isopenicillin N synthase-like dioxygenase